MKKILLILLFGLGIFSAQSQITVDNTLTVQQLIDNVLVLGQCAEVNNITSPNNSSVGGESFDSFGAFDGTSSPQNFPFDGGIVLATNGIDMVPDGQPAQGGGFGWAGDPDLEALIQEPGNTNNATVIEFEFIPFVDNISFNYLLASDEYPGFVCTFADTFAFILNGPGISNVNDYNHDANPNTPDVTLDLGGQNIAVIPGTNIPVSPVNIHTNTNCGAGTLGEFAVPQLFDNVNSDNGSTMYDGQTVPLTASADVIPGQTYNIKLVIADRGDTILNSAVFLESESFDLGGIDLGPDITISNGTAPCEGETVTLDAGFSANNIQYFWAKDGTIIPGENSQTLEVTENGDYEVGIQIGAGGTACFGVSNVVTVEFFPEPEFAPNTPIDLCAGDTITLDGEPTNSSVYTSIDYQWFKDGVELTGETNSTLDVTDGGQYEVIIDANACEDTPNNFVVNLIDYQVSLPTPPDNCLSPGETIEISPAFTGLTPAEISQVSYSWSTGETTPTIELSQGETVTLTTTFNGCDEVATETFTFFNNPEVSITGSAVICQGDTNTLDATPSNSADLTSTDFTWSKDGTVLNGETNATLDITDGGLYEVTVDNNGCSTTTQLQVELVDYQVTLPIPSQTCVGAGETVEIVPSFTGLTQAEISQVSYSWSTGETTPTIELSQGQSVTLTTTFNGCDEVVTETFTFFNNPEVSITGSAVICQGDTNTLDATPSNSADLTSTDFTWSKDGTVLNGETNATLDITDGGLYEVTVDNNGCSTTAQLQVELVDYQVTLPIPSQTCVGAGETVEIVPSFTGLTQAEVSQVNYSWSTGETTPTIELSQGQDVTLTTTFNGCDETVTQTFTIFDIPEVDIAGSSVICSGDTNTLDATPMNLNDLQSPTYSWTRDGVALPDDTPTLDITEGGVYEVTIDNNSCVSTDQIDVEMVDYTLDLGGDQNLCTGEGGPQNITLTPTVTGLTSAQENQILYTWSDGSTDETLTVSESGTFTLETDVNGCIQTAQVIVSIVETIDVSLEDIVKCPEDEVLIDSGLPENDPNITYSWTRDGSPVGDNSPSVNASVEGDYEITVNNQGCISTATAVVSGYNVDNCVITQGISPNEDGDNDCMDLAWLNDQLGIDKFEVFNRYGRKVFEETNYIDTFCGQDDDGDELSTGTYFYVINLASSDERFERVVKGWVYINLEQ